MIGDNTLVEGQTDVVADNVVELQADAPVNSLVYLIQPNGEYVAGLYLKSEESWIRLSAGEVVF